MAIRATYPPGEASEAAEICLKCGVCCNVAHGCHVMYDRRFDPTHTFVYDCLASKSGPYNPNIWMCVSCHKCEETCPYEVSPIHYIEALKGEALKAGWVHQTIRDELAQVVSTGFAFQLSASTERQRQVLGLKPLPVKPLDDLTKIAKKTKFINSLREGA